MFFNILSNCKFFLPLKCSKWFLPLWLFQVVEGKAKEIITGHATSKVIVKILHEDATPTDQSYFLHEAKPFRNLKHPNVLHLVGRCLETHPFLLLFEECSTVSFEIVSCVNYF